jgi:O-antigen ligase
MTLWPLAGLLALGALQLVPIPAILHVVAPGSGAVWHPAVAEAAAVLGPGSRPVSLLPEGTRAWLGESLGIVALTLVAAPAAASRRTAVRAAIAVALGGLAVAVYGVVARTLFGPLLFGRLVVPTVSPFGPFVSKNHFAGYVEMAALLALGLAAGLADGERTSRESLSWTGSPRAWQPLTAFAVALAMGLSVLVSLSRGGAVSLAAGCLAFVVLRAFVRRHRPGGRWRGRLFGAAAAASIVAAMALVLPREAHERIGTLGAVAGEEAASFRLRVWKDALWMAVHSPVVGYGMGAFGAAFPRYKTSNGELRVEHAENDYLQMLAEGGSAGLGLALLAVALGLRRVVSGLARQSDRVLRGIGVGSTAGIVALLVHSAFDFNLRIPSNATLFALLAALALGAGAGEARSLGRSGAWAFAALPALGLVVALWPRGPASLTPARENLATAHALLDPEAQGLRLMLAEESLSAWVRRHPADAEAWFLLGWSRAMAGRRDGLAVARYAVSLDPLRPGLGAELDRLESHAGALP